MALDAEGKGENARRKSLPDRMVPSPLKRRNKVRKTNYLTGAMSPLKRNVDAQRGAVIVFGKVEKEKKITDATHANYTPLRSRPN